MLVLPSRIVLLEGIAYLLIFYRHCKITVVHDPLSVDRLLTADDQFLFATGNDRIYTCFIVIA